MPIAVGAPTSASEDSGVGIYTLVLRTALAESGYRSLLIDAAMPVRSRTRVSRWIHAARPWCRPAKRTAYAIAIPDAFREAQVHFDLYGKLMDVMCEGPAGLAHWTYPVPLRMLGWRNVYTIHDVIPMTHPKLSPVDGGRQRRLLQAVQRSAAGLVTVSEHARGEIMAALGPGPSVVNLGQAVTVDETWPERALPEGLGAQSFLLCCGAIEPRKNVSRLIEAYVVSGIAVPLVFAGPPGAASGPLLRLISDTPGVRWLGRLEREDMLNLMRAAKGLLMPSLAEGFGLPVAEALAMGVPVLTSRGGALEEIAAGEADLVDPEDVGMIAIGLRRLAYATTSADAPVGSRGERFARGPYAERLIAYYRELLS